MTINAETQTVKLKSALIAPKSGNSYSPGIYKPGTLPQSLCDKYPEQVEIVNTDVESVEKSGVVKVNDKVIIKTEIVDNAEPVIPEVKVVDKTPKRKVETIRPVNAAE